MTEENLKALLDEIFFNFEENIFDNVGVWPRKVNLIFSFSDYIRSLSDEDIGEILETDEPNEIKKFRKTAQDGVEYWLNENMKTLML